MHMYTCVSVCSMYEIILQLFHAHEMIQYVGLSIDYIFIIMCPWMGVC